MIRRTGAVVRPGRKGDLMTKRRSSAFMLATFLALSPSLVRTQTDAGDDGEGGRRFELVSRDDAGRQGNNDSDRAAISAGGRFVAFASIADNLVPGDNNFSSDVFVRDRRTDTTERVSVGPLGVEGDGNSGMLAGLGNVDISRDGRFVAFASESSNFVAGDVPFTADVFVHDRTTHTTELISRGTDGLPAGGSTGPSISGDGRLVAFRSFSDRLVPEGNPDFRDHVFVVDRLTHAIERIDLANDGTLSDGGALNVRISADGSVVAFDSDASNLVPGDGDQAFDVFVRDRRRGRTEGVSNRRPSDTFNGQSLLSSISGDGRFVGFESTDPTLVRDDGNGFFSDAFVFDREGRRLRLVSRNRDDEPGNDDSFDPHVSDDGRFVVFSSRASNLVRRDTNQSVDVFRRDLEEGRTERLAADDISEDQPFGFDVVATAITPNAGRVALLTRADLAPEQDVGFFVADVYVLEPRRH
jgi:Tol biopolymer transport system component